MIWNDVCFDIAGVLRPVGLSSGRIMKITKYALAALGLIGLAMPGSSRANSFTFSVSGISQQGTVTAFSLGSSGGFGGRTVNLLTISTPLSDPLTLAISGLGKGAQFQTVMIDSFKSVNGVSTLVGILEFDGDVLSGIALSAPGGSPLDNLTFTYLTETTTVVGGGGGPGPTPTPEPSSLLLLSTGLFGLMGMALLRRRLA